MPPALRFADEFWAALGGPPSVLPALSVTGEGDLPSAYRVTEFAAASMGVAGLAAAELATIATTIGATDAVPAVTVDRALASTWFGSAVEPVGWKLPGVWDPLARNYRAKDGWIRLHTNFAHHRDAALSVLDIGPDLIDVRRMVSRWSAIELENAIVAAGGCAAVMRTKEEWLAHPQGAAVAAAPLIEWRTGAPGAPGERWRPTSDRPLAGLRVLDLTRVIAGPVATRFLAGLGADVLRIDPPDWDEVALVPNMTLGKRAAFLDLTTGEGLERLRELVRNADVLAHGYRHGALEALGLDFAALQELRPGLVEVSLDAYGFSGPWAERRGFDSLVQMSAGIAQRGMEWAGSDEPHPLPVQALDHASGYLLAAATLRALTRLRTDGVGGSARTSLARVAVALDNGGELPADGALVARAQPSLPLETPWGAAAMLPAAVGIAGIPLAYDRGPRDLGSDPASWD